MAPAPVLHPPPEAYTLLESPLDLVPDDPSSDSLFHLERRTASLGGTNLAALGSPLGVRAEGGAMDGGLAMRSIGGRSVSLKPNSTQSVTIGVIGAYAVVIGILWHVPVLKWILWPWKILTISFHEFGHAATGCCTGAHIKSISLDPREGGVTQMSGGINAITLPAGYLGSSFIGALLIFCGFDVTASKIASFFLGATFLLTLWWGRRDWLTIGTVLFAVGILVAFWFIDHAEALRFYVLFVGVMSNLYSVWDIIDDLILRKLNESDASVFAKRYGGSSACWGVLWAIVALLFMACGIVGGIAAFPETFAQQDAASKTFLPTM